VKNTEDLRIRVEKSINDELTRFCEARVIKKQAVVDGLMEWFCSQDDMLRLLLVGRMPEDYAGQILDLVYESLKAKMKGGRKSRTISHVGPESPDKG
jgi:hypothetical protein